MFVKSRFRGSWSQYKASLISVLGKAIMARFGSADRKLVSRNLIPAYFPPYLAQPSCFSVLNSRNECLSYISMLEDKGRVSTRAGAGRRSPFVADGGRQQTCCWMALGLIIKAKSEWWLCCIVVSDVQSVLRSILIGFSMPVVTNFNLLAPILPRPLASEPASTDSSQMRCVKCSQIRHPSRLYQTYSSYPRTLF